MPLLGAELAAGQRVMKMVLLLQISTSLTIETALDSMSFLSLVQ